MFASWLSQSCVLRSILKSLENQARERLSDIWGNLIMPKLMRHGTVFMCGQGKKSFLAPQGTIFGPDQLSPLKTQYSPLLQANTHQESNTLAAHGNDLNDI